MAESLPESEFIGIDSSAHQIEKGNATLEQLDVNNLELRHLDIADIDESFGKFDYIICHGVYSWVPKKIQDAILDLCRSRLNENGVAYVSYNTYPGWHLRGAIRDMMCYHARNFESPQEQINQARELLKFLAASAKTRFEAYPKMLQQEAESLSKRSDSYIYHEFLAAVNEPIYFHEFVDRVHSAGMKYVADADVRTMLSRAFDEEAAGLLRNVPLLRREQYMDFLRSRMFRASLLCQSEAGPRVAGSASCLLPLHVTLTSLMPAKKEGDGRATWKHPHGTITTKSPMTEVLQLLTERWPGWVSVQEIVDGPVKDATYDQDRFLQDLMNSMLEGVIQIGEQPVPIATTISDRPRCGQYARLQAELSETVTNRRHVDVRCERLTRLVIAHADGESTADDLAKVIEDAAASGKFSVTDRDASVNDPSAIDWVPVVRQELARLAAGSLLVE